MLDIIQLNLYHTPNERQAHSFGTGTGGQLREGSSLETMALMLRHPTKTGTTINEGEPLRPDRAPGAKEKEEAKALYKECLWGVPVA